MMCLFQLFDFWLFFAVQPKKRTSTDLSTCSTQKVKQNNSRPTMTTSTACASALAQRLSEARALRTDALSEDDLCVVEGRLREILANLSSKNDSQEDITWTNSGIFLATLLLQRGEESATTEASALLSERGFAYRLSTESLRHNHSTPSNPPTRYAACFDGILRNSLLRRLDTSFGPTSKFWRHHDYSDGSGGKDPSPYFSYIVPINNGDSTSQQTALDVIIRRIQTQTSEVFPDVNECKYCEWWAHCRPHSSGHQLHFDSDDEGRDGVRNPVCSTVINLSSDDGMGGETLVTTQTSSGRALATKGWLCSNKRNRLLVFRGDLLHGVVPGPRVAARATDDIVLTKEEAREGRRVTFMVAFWKDIRIQDEEGHGSARPFSRVAGEEWAKPLVDVVDDGEKEGRVGKAKDSFFQVPVWSDVSVEKNRENGVSVKEIRKYKLALPPYEDFFQFFS
jgi:hypothetical protein